MTAPAGDLLWRVRKSPLSPLYAPLLALALVFIRFSEVTVPEASHCVGKTLADLRVAEHTGVLVIAISDPASDAYSYNPSGSHQIRGGTVLVVIGSTDQMKKLRALVS